jgi:hypothetical protein
MAGGSCPSVGSCDTLSLNMTTSARGGARAGAGRPSIFKAKALGKPFAMNFTPGGRRVLDALVRRTGLSRNAVLGVLALKHGDRLAFDTANPFPDKVHLPLSIRVPPEAGAKLAAARVRTGRSYSDVGEALVRWFGADTPFPAPATTAPRRRRP